MDISGIIRVISLKDLWHALELSGILVGIILFMLTVYYFLVEPVRKRRKVSQRLVAASQDYLQQMTILREKLKDRSNRFSYIFGTLGSKKIAALQGQLLKGNIFWDPLTFVGLTLLLGATGFCLGSMALRSYLWALLLACVLGAIPWRYLKRAKRKKAMEFEVQLPDAMELLARSLRAGHTLPSAIELLSEEMVPPLATEMRIAYEEQRFGIGMPEALVNMLERVDSHDLSYFVTAVLIQQETGGNLVELTEKIGHIIRARLNFKLKIFALTADGRLSALILTVLPIFMFFLLLGIKPEYEGVLIYADFGRQLLFVSALFIVSGIYIMRKMVKDIEA
jgi:tight adherence protein B